jgi:hypothetical protein
VDWAQGSVDHGRTAVYESMVDHRRRRGRNLPEEGHVGAPVRGTSPWQLGEQEEEMGILTEVFDGWCGDGGWPTVGLDGGSAKSSKERHWEARRSGTKGSTMGSDERRCERGLYIGSGRGIGGGRGGNGGRGNGRGGERMGRQRCYGWSGGAREASRWLEVSRVAALQPVVGGGLGCLTRGGRG